MRGILAALVLSAPVSRCSPIKDRRARGAGVEKSLSNYVRVFTSEDTLRVERDRTQARAFRVAIDFEVRILCNAVPVAEPLHRPSVPRLFAELAGIVVLIVSAFSNDLARRSIAKRFADAVSWCDARERRRPCRMASASAARPFRGQAIFPIATRVMLPRSPPSSPVAEATALDPTAQSAD